MEADLLRAYYFSAGQNYTAFKNKKDKGDAASPAAGGGSPVESPAVAPKERATKKIESPAAEPAIAASPANAAPAAAAPAPTPAPSSKTKAAPAAAPAPAAVVTKSAPVGSAVSAAKRKDAPTSAPGIDAASKEYIQFLKQQQDLHKCHNKLEELITSFESHRHEEQRDLSKVRSQAADLLREMEEGTGWNLKSKYTVENIIKDAGLQLHGEQLYSSDAEPQYFEIVQQAANLQKLKQDHHEKEQYGPHKVSVNNGMRRLERVEKELKNSQVDATELARVPDTLLIQLEHVFTSPTIQTLLESHEESMEHLLFKLEQAKEDREEALEDGEMQLAEKHYYSIVEHYEELQATVLEKLNIAGNTLKETAVFDKVRGNYQDKAAEEVRKIKAHKERLKNLCEDDTRKLFSLRERIEDVEKQMVLKMAEDCRKSDAMLQQNTERLNRCWAKIEECETELAMLEKDRHKEVKKRIDDKEKDEQRRMEFDRFCTVCDKHIAHLDLTIKNCESLIHVANLVGEFVQGGFGGLAKDFQSKTKNLSEVQLHLHKEHLAMFRGLFLALGELTHKKEKKIEEVDKQIQTSHINQELCADTLNPNAKKFSDVKKELLHVRDDLEQDVRCLKEQASSALEKFVISEQALKAADVEFIHPVVEHEDMTLATRAKMVEFKAIAIGHVDSVPIRNEIEHLKRQIQVTQQHVTSINNNAVPHELVSLPGIKPGNTTTTAN
eukprot:TRINITY_DN11126_c0_g2_i1.p1 TRINITY_DN11126_c0_g2~~TRINITY_DN11126_c0_g2_i1.p1  ORF type:complete len:749 (+),score=272.42 TRINITY_DN11126_c0_g2_i1:81-2249(+)